MKNAFDANWRRNRLSLGLKSFGNVRNRWNLLLLWKFAIVANCCESGRRPARLQELLELVDSVMREIRLVEFIFIYCLKIIMVFM